MIYQKGCGNQRPDLKSIFVKAEERNENPVVMAFELYLLGDKNLAHQILFPKCNPLPNASSHNPTVKVGDSEEAEVSEQNRKGEVINCQRCDGTGKCHNCNGGGVVTYMKEESK